MSIVLRPGSDSTTRIAVMPAVPDSATASTWKRTGPAAPTASNIEAKSWAWVGRGSNAITDREDAG